MFCARRALFSFVLWGIIALTTAGMAPASASAQDLALDGKWVYRLDPTDTGESSGWMNALTGDGTVTLPGTSDTLRLGPVSTDRSEWRLNRLYRYRGAIWFARELTVPENWAGKAAVLELERVQWESRVWVNGQPAGMQDSLSVPHRYDVTRLIKPGVNRIILRIDNRIKYKVHHTYGDAVWLHAITDETQGNWNGVIGSIKLSMSPLVSLQMMRIEAPAETPEARVQVQVNNRTDRAETVSLRAAVAPGGAQEVAATVTALPGISTHALTVPLRADAPLWDEFNPKRLRARITLTRPTAERHTIQAYFGRVSFLAGPKRFLWNGRPASLRGNLECAIWPLTGHPPMTADAGWTRLMRVIKQHGMNHLRFHSWCPPKAAFEAADAAGVVLQVELPLWDGYGNLASDPERCVWLPEEARRILQEYGNHPSFRLMSMGNELGGPNDPWLMDLVRSLQQYDRRVLYASTTHPVSDLSDDDYHDAAGTAAGAVRGLLVAPSGRPSGDGVFSSSLAPLSRPLISHEIGQYSMFFNPDEIKKYAGVMKPTNLEMCRDAMQRNGLLHMAERFRRSSARFQLSLYKREIETLLSTPDLAGFQALGLQDFPGQGTTMCGVLDSFWDSKGVVSSADWRRFCAPTVVLARFAESIYTDDQVFSAHLQLAHFGPKDLPGAVLQWELRSGNRTVAKGETAPIYAPTGAVTTVGNIQQPLHGLVRYPAQLNLAVSLKDSRIRNDWDIWVYPADNEPLYGDDILVADAWDDNVKEALQGGRDVLILTDWRRLMQGVETRWYPVFWNTLLFAQQPSSIGLHMNPKHPVFRQFPTRDHSDVQWSKLQEGAGAVDLSNSAIDPLVWVVDDFHTAYQRKLGALFESGVLNGRLVVCTFHTADDARNRPEVRQLLTSLLSYMKSPQFRPAITPVEELNRVLATQQVVEGMSSEPSGLVQAPLHIRAAAATDGATPYDKSQDGVIRCDNGFAYRIQCDISWKDSIATAWVGTRMEVHLQAPKGITGHLAVRVDDWNRQHRDGRLFWNGHDKGHIGSHAPGRWILLPLDPDVQVYTLRLERTNGPNLMITDIAVLPN